MKFSLFILFLLPAFFASKVSSAQWFLDKATPEETAIRDAPYLYLQKEIENKLCNNVWGIDKTHFKFLTENPDWQLVLRGKGIHRLNFTDNGGACAIQLKENSPEYKAIFNQQFQLSQNLMKKISEGKARISGPESKKESRLNRQLENDKIFAQIHVTLNDDRIQGSKLEYYRATKVVHLKDIPGVQQALLYYQLPDEDTPDTSFRLALYIGNFPKYSGKMEGVHFKAYRKEPWIDKQNSGAPVIENISIWIYCTQYNRIMKVTHNIDWTGLGKFVQQ